jgi:NAD(P)-dependent dehydrogenase (short-subunit alcohol dehydrogenase family)
VGAIAEWAAAGGSRLIRAMDRVVAVTGGGRGIGLAIVERFLGQGCSVAVLERDLPEGYLDRLEAADHVLALGCDVSRDIEVEHAFAEVAARWGRVDVLVNNAGVNAYFDAVEMTSEEWDRFMAVDLKAVWLCSRHAIPLMRPTGGTIINVASIHAFMTTPGMFPYAAAKSGVVGLTRSLALDHGPENIRVVAVCPGWVRTHLVDEWLAQQEDPVEAERQVLDAHPLRRMGRPEDIAAFIAFLASDEASFITGVPLLIDGGLSARFSS